MYILLKDDVVCSRGEGFLSAVLNCKYVKISVEEVEDSLKYYLILPKYCVCKKRLIVTTSKDVGIKRALENKELKEICTILELEALQTI